MSCRRTLAVVVLLALVAPAAAAPPAAPLLPDGTLESLTGSLRTYLVQAMPRPLVESNSGWGATKRVPDGVKWRGQGLRVRPEMQYAVKNHGTWKRLRVTAENPQDTLIFDLRNLRQPDDGPATFDAFVAFDARVEYERQVWDAGLRLYSGSTRARLRVKLALKCEAASRLEKTDGLVPDVVFRLRVRQADLGYDNFVCEHVAGLGGEVAKLLGDAARGGLRRFHPSLERDLLARANAAIVRAADTKEVRVGLGKALNR